MDEYFLTHRRSATDGLIRHSYIQSVDNFHLSPTVWRKFETAIGDFSIPRFAGLGKKRESHSIISQWVPNRLHPINTCQASITKLCWLISVSANVTRMSDDNKLSPQNLPRRPRVAIKISMLYASIILFTDLHPTADTSPSHFRFQAEEQRLADAQHTTSCLIL